MPGFVVSNFKNQIQPENSYNDRCVRNEYTYAEYWMRRNTLNKYMNDKLFMEDEKLIIILEGVILNKKELLEEYCARDMYELVCNLINNLGDCFFKSFKGAFSGAYFSKSEKKWLFFTDQLGTKPLYYYHNDGKFVVGSQLNYVTDTMHVNAIKRRPDEHGLGCMMVYGSFIDDSTGVQEVKRVYPGDYILINQNGLEVGNYYTVVPKNNAGLSEREYIDLLDDKFCAAVKSMLDKDEEYGYKTIIDISGGVDSRMIAYVAHKLNCKNAIMLSYSQSGGREYKIAQEVANKLGYDFYFKSLDNGSCLLSIDDNVKMNNGSATYRGITGGKDFLEIINEKSFGIEMTGLLGDIYDCSMVVVDGTKKPYERFDRFRFGRVLSYDESCYSRVIDRFPTHELFWFYTRGMICGMSSFPIRQNFVEPLTPFGDVDFMEAYLSISWELRVKEKLLSKWMVIKYPEAAKIMYAATGVSLADEFTFGGKIKKTVKFFVQEVYRQLGWMHKGYSMNPFEFWIKSNPDIAEYIDAYYQDNIGRTKGKLREKVEMLMCAEGAVEDKFLALTVLGYYKQFLD